jgi:hypothetical protein
MMAALLGISLRFHHALLLLLLLLPLLLLNSNQKYCALIAVGGFSTAPWRCRRALPVPVTSTAFVSPARIFLINLSANTGTGSVLLARAAASRRAVL